jgi:tRNA dimethylallyltransferase
MEVPREELYARCDARLLKMIEAGALEEVRCLMERQLPAMLPVMKVVGVPELLAYLRGDFSLEEAVAKAQQSTRNYAKRQLTWLRHQVVPHIKLFPTDAPEVILSHI